MITKAYLGHYEVACLIAGDRDFVSVVRAVKEYTGRIVIGLYEPTSVSDELIRAFDHRIQLSEEELRKLMSKILTNL